MKKIRIVLFLILTVSLFANSFVFVQASDEDALISDCVEKFSANTKCNSVSVAIVSGGETKLIGDSEGLYQIGSMTKAFTGLGIQKLIQDGLITENDNISDWLPGFEVYYNNEPCDITIGQLLKHTSGYTNKEADYPSATGTMSLAEWVGSISGRELSAKPGTGYAYSNVNYNLLGAIIEQASGKSYKEYMESEILGPLGLENTCVQEPADGQRIIQGSRLGYRHSFTYIIPIAPGQIPAGYFYSNTTDMARWMQIWTGTADIPEQYEDLICKVKDNLKDTGDYYSGWEFFDNESIGHSGGTPNYSSRIVFSDEKQIGVCVLTNMNVAASTDSLCNGIYATYIGQRFDKIQTDVWTVFDYIFTAVTIMGVFFVIMSFTIKHRGVLIGSEIFLVLLLVTVCIVMPLVFGAGLDKIMIIWAPNSFAGGLIMLAAGVISIAAKLWMVRKNEN